MQGYRDRLLEGRGRFGARRFVGQVMQRVYGKGGMEDEEAGPLVLDHPQ
jgi:hypothetical protein